MASQPTSQSAARRPRLSLQIKTTSLGSSSSKSQPRSFPVNPSDPTAFNTLSNAYVTAIERSTPIQAEPITAINTLQNFSLASPIEQRDLKLGVTTPYVATYPETPVTAHASSPPQKLEIDYRHTMTATPPLSAGPVESNGQGIFTFSPPQTLARLGAPSTLASPVEGRSSRQRPSIAAFNPAMQAPYTHSRALHSILRNSPLPPRTAIPPSPRRQSRRLLEKAAKKVEYNSPLTQDITTNKYIRSHIDLLVEEASPSPSSPAQKSREQETVLDLALAFTANEIQDGGQTPGPFEDMRRRMAGLVASSPLSPAESGGIRKRKKKDREKKRQWVWTIGKSEEDEDADVGRAEIDVKAHAALAMAKAAGDVTMSVDTIPRILLPETPTPSIESSESGTDAVDGDVEMSDTSSVVSEDYSRLAPTDMELDMKTPTGPGPSLVDGIGVRLQKRDTPIPELEGARDTPVPPELR